MADSRTRPRPTAWGRALELAARTPPSRNRYADFLRAASIMVVILGHWMMAAPYLVDGEPRLAHLLDIESWSHWLTWALQVMPIFFIVGGFSNAISWQKATERNVSYAHWLDSRFRRLVAPALPLLVAWLLLGAAAVWGGVAADTLRVGSQVALVPTWFLAVYLLVILPVPWTFRLWQGLGLASFGLLALAAVLVDIAAFGAGVTGMRWLNYLFVWGAVHQLGYAWQAGKLGGWRLPAFSITGFAALFALVSRGPYPVSMVGVPGEKISNSLPPTIALLALGMFQGGLLLALEKPARRWLERRRAWATTVLVNANIMTLFLWHSTVMVLVIGALMVLGGPGLGLTPGTGSWWLSRIPWALALGVLLSPFLAVFGRFERPSPRSDPATSTPAAWRLLVGSLFFCAGIGLLAFHGVGGGPLGIRLGLLALPFIGAFSGAVVAFSRET